MLRLPMGESWFEDNEEIRIFLAGAPNRKTQVKHLKAYLDVRREYWAKQALKAGGIAKSAGVVDWMGLAASAWALLEGRALGKIPMMEHVIDCTIAAFEANHMGRVLPEIEFFDGPEDFHAEDLQAMINPHWLDGFLASILIAPKAIQPQKWMGAFLELLSSNYNEEELIPLVDVCLIRHQELGMAFSEDEMIPDLGSVDKVFYPKSDSHDVNEAEVA